MEYSFKFIVPRTPGDDETFDKIFKANLPNIESEVISVFDEATVKYNIFAKYNKAIEELIKKDVGEKDIWVFCHNDCGILDNDFQKKVELLFTTYPNTSVVGVVGTSELRENGCWWTSPGNCLRGHLIQGSKQKKPMEGSHLIKGSIGYFDNIVCVDGLFMVVRGKAVADSGIRFRNDIFSDNHFYDLSFCLDMLLKGYGVAVADILVYHQSCGSSNGSEVWTTERDKFMNYYKGLGLSFPLDKKTIESFNINKRINQIEKQIETMEFKF